MAFATQIDDNDFPAIYGISAVDGVTPVRIGFDTATGSMKIDMVSTATIAKTSFVDDNSKPVAKGVKDSDGTTPVPWYVNPTTHGVLIEV